MGNHAGDANILESVETRAAMLSCDYVILADVKEYLYSVLSHQFVLGTDAELSEIIPPKIFRDFLQTVELPSRNAATKEAVVASNREN